MNEKTLLWTILAVALVGTVVSIKIGLGLQAVKDQAAGLEEKGRGLLHAIFG